MRSSGIWQVLHVLSRCCIHVLSAAHNVSLYHGCSIAVAGVFLLTRLVRPGLGQLQVWTVHQGIIRLL